MALAPGFTQTLLRHAHRGPVLMVVRDPAYGPVFLRMLRQMQVPRETIGRFKIVGPEDIVSQSRVARGTGAVYVSPLVARKIVTPQIQGLRRIRAGNYLAAASIDRLKAQLALDLAMPISPST